MRFQDLPVPAPIRRVGPSLDQRAHEAIISAVGGHLHLRNCRRRSNAHVFTNIAELRASLRRGCSSAYGQISPSLALQFQARCGAEIAFDWIIERATRRVIGLVTRGEAGIAASNLLLYYKLEARFLVRTGFHTHPSIENHAGRHMPSLADFLALRNERAPVGTRSAVASVYFPDGVQTRYGLLRDGVGVVRIGQGPPQRVDLAALSKGSSGTRSSGRATWIRNGTRLLPVQPRTPDQRFWIQ